MPSESDTLRLFHPSRLEDFALLLFCGVILLYSLLIVQQILVGLLVVLTVLFFVFGVRFLRWFVASYRRRTDALESIASSLDTMADEDDDAGTDRD